MSSTTTPIPKGFKQMSVAKNGNGSDLQRDHKQMAPKKGPRGERPRHFTCFGVKQTKNNSEPIKARVYFHEDGSKYSKADSLPEQGIWAPAGAELSAELAGELFQKEMKVAPDFIDGPCFDVIGKNRPTSENRVAVSLNAADIRYTTERWKAKFQGFKVVANGLAACTSRSGEAYEENDLVFLIVQEGQKVINAEGKTISKPKFGASIPVVRRSALENPVKDAVSQK